MLTAVAFLVLPTLVASSGKDNIHLLEDEAATALRSCLCNESSIQTRGNGRPHRNSNDYNYQIHIPRIDNEKPDDMRLYAHEKRNSTEIYVLKGKKNDIPICDVKYVKTATMPSGNANNYTVNSLVRRKRDGHLINGSDQDQCLSQCVFANLHVVNEQGVPREAELWNKVQTALTSEESRKTVRGQIRACFQELQSENEENRCSYSNKLERCLMLRFSDRQLNG